MHGYALTTPYKPAQSCFESMEGFLSGSQFHPCECETQKRTVLSTDHFAFVPVHPNLKFSLKGNRGQSRNLRIKCLLVTSTKKLVHSNAEFESSSPTFCFSRRRRRLTINSLKARRTHFCINPAVYDGTCYASRLCNQRLR